MREEPRASRTETPVERPAPPPPASAAEAAPPAEPARPEHSLAAATTPAPAPAAAGGPTRTSVVISKVPGFSRALALQRAIQGLSGVTEARALGYERGVLDLEVQHDGAVELAERVVNLPGIRLTVVENTPGQLQLAAEA